MRDSDDVAGRQRLPVDPARAAASVLAAALVAVPSVNPALEEGGTGEGEIAALCAGWLREWGFSVEVVESGPGRPNVLARLRRGAGPRLLLYGHLDTVGVAGMTVSPFGADVRDGRLWGRGAADMKGGVAAVLVAAREAARAGRFHGELIVALVADEEWASEGMDALVAAGLTADGAVVCEPTELAIMPAHKGFAWMEVVFRGRAAHGSRPDEGVDAIRHAGHFLARLDEIEAELAARPAHPLLGHGTIHAGTIHGGTAFSVYPAECRVGIERRTLPGETAESAAGQLRALLERLRPQIPALDATVVPGLARPGTEVDPDSPLARALATAIAAGGRRPAFRGMTAWVDAAILNEAGIPALCFGPGSIAAAHTADESAPVAEIDEAADVLGRLIHEFCAG